MGRKRTRTSGGEKFVAFRFRRSFGVAGCGDGHSTHRAKGNSTSM